MSDVTPPSTTPPTTATLNQKLAAEAVGAAILVFVGLQAGAIAFGFTYFALVLAFGAASGGHFNPAVSIGTAMAGRLTWKDAGLYSAAQIVGGLVAGIALLLMAITQEFGPGFGDDGFGAPGFGDRAAGGADLLPALILELVLSFAFVLVVLALRDGRLMEALLVPLGVGLAYGAVASAGGNTGSVVNPAEALATVFWSGSDAIVQAWLFVLVPLIGAALAGLLHPALFGRDAEPILGSGLNFASSSAAPQGYAAPGQWGQPQQGYQGGYDPSGATPGYDPNAYAAPQAQAAAAPAQEQPIIQDGWQWEPQSQTWIPAQQQPPAQPAATDWQAPGETGGQTQVRPPGY